MEPSQQSLPQLAIIVPCYNEEIVLPETFQQLQQKLTQLITARQITDTSFILLVDDGSQDATWHIITQLSQQYTHCRGIKLSRNFGHQAALLCGLQAVTDEVDCAVTIDADLQDDIEVLDKFIAQFKAGFDVVYGVRKERSSDSFLKKYTATAFYQLMRLLGTPVIYNHADYRLLSQRALKHLANFSNNSLFLRGTVPLLGFKSCCIYYQRRSRYAGTTKYSLNKMLNLALNGIITLSTAPLRLITLLGITSFLFSMLILISFTANTALHHQSIPIWLFIFLPICFIGSIQLISLGIIGEYLGRIYHEAKINPNYIIAKHNL